MKSVPIFSANSSYELIIQKSKNGKNLFLNKYDKMKFVEEENKKKLEEQFNEFLKQLDSEFTEEEIAFLKANWTPPK